MDQQQQAPAPSTHSPTLRVGDMVQFDCGDHQGVCGELTWVSLVTKRLVVTTQNDEFLEGIIDEVSKI